MRDDKERLTDILDSIKLLEIHLPQSRELHQLNELEFMGIVRCIEIIGEACRYLTDKFKSEHSEVPWREIANMRNILAHQYFNVDEERIEKAVKSDIPKLKLRIEEILKNKI